ncbi:glutathione S-transferase/GST-like protein [Aminobacter aminovorans]|uniref:Glutathione S-transferase GST-4.5 n=2 Tax=Aminobacter aminovorans TaxID=83263 RepID=A0A380WFI2_AMIAI|nr:glutathione S-transferase/GST-like protein [Aminobacter aminovorans]SUU86884.1 Glutathione S-transferase GST-4.5 [Aminobacter aminovorans]
MSYPSAGEERLGAEMYRLYTRAGSGGFVVEAAFALAGVPFERIEVVKGVEPAAEFRKISPLGQVPALVLPDGQAMTESAAMCQLIAERHPYARLAPSVDASGRADFLRWMAFLTSVTYPALLREYYAHRYTTDALGIEAVKAAAIAEAERSFGVVEAALQDRDWLAGTHMSIADVYLLMLAYWHPEPGKLALAWPNIARLCTVLKEDAVLTELNASHAMW